MPASSPGSKGLLPEQIDRELCERSLHHFIRSFWVEIEGPATPFHDGWHIGAICEYLEAVANGEIRNLLINVPPRCMKSIATSVAFPAWLWALRPDEGRPLKGAHVRFLSASYGRHLAADHSGMTLSLILSPRYQRYWGDRVELTRMGRERFDNTAHGYRIATSVEGRATGVGGNIILVDDPANAREAQSDVERENVRNWWRQTMSSRINDPLTGARIIIAQRLHHNDLPGYVIERGTFEHLCLPMRYEPDHPFMWVRDPRKEDRELLWPGHVPEEEVRGLENEMGPYTAAGQLQQRPAPREGGMFSRSKAQYADAVPPGGTSVRGWDLGGSKQKTSPWTAGVRITRVRPKGERFDRFYVEHSVRERTNADEMRALIRSTAEGDGKQVTVDIPQDPGQAGKDQVRNLTSMLAGYKVRSNPETGAKEVRAEPFSAQWEGGNVYMVKGPWNTAFVDELCMFPASDYSDQVDAASRAFARLAARRRRAAGGGILIT